MFCESIVTVHVSPPAVALISPVASQVEAESRPDPVAATRVAKSVAICAVSVSDAEVKRSVAQSLEALTASACAAIDLALS